MKLLNIYGVGIGALLLGLISTPAMAFSIDFFDSTNVNTYNPPFNGATYNGQRVEIGEALDLYPSTDTDTNLSNVIGGQRTISVTRKAQPAGGSGAISLNVNPTNRTASFDVASQSAGSFSIDWNGNFGSQKNFTAGGLDALEIGVLQVDNNGITFNFGLTDGLGNSGVITKTVNSSGNARFLYNDIVQNGSNQANLDLTNISSLKFYTSGEPESSDLAFDFIQTINSQAVPFEFSPSMGLVFFGGLFGVHRLKKKLKSC